MSAGPPNPTARGGESYRTPSREQAPSEGERRRRLVTRTAPIVVISAGSFLVGVLVGASAGGSDAARRFADAWERQDFTAMHTELSPPAQERYPLKDFTARYVDAQATATAIQVVTEEPEDVEAADAEAEAFDATVDTEAFGQVRGSVE